MSHTKKMISAVVLIALGLGGYWHMESGRTAERQKVAKEILAAAVQESQNCLYKLSGWRDRLDGTYADLKPHITSCYVKRIAIEVPASEDACIGLIGIKKDISDKVTLNSIRVGDIPLGSDACQSGAVLHFEFETTESGQAWYNDLLHSAKKRDMESGGIDSSTSSSVALEQLVGNNASPDEVMASLKQREKQVKSAPVAQAKHQIYIGTIISMQRRLDDEKLYDISVAVDNEGMKTMVQNNDLGLKPNDSVILDVENGHLKIREKFNHD